MQKNIFVFFLVFVLSSVAVAQELKDDLTRIQNGEDLNVMYRNESSFGLYAHSAGGIGIAYRRGYHVTGKRKRMLELETQNFKNLKEIKSVSSYNEHSKGFVYGKLNSFLLIRPGIGFQNIIYEKSDKKSVEVRFSYFVGATLAFAKPIYLEIINSNTNTISTERYDPDKHYPSEIYGKAPFFKGMSNTKIYPGGYAKLALSFDYAERYNAVKAIEVGTLIDVYPVPLPVMAFNKKQQFSVQLYLKMVWGKKWF
jgi:hypothetical protein